MTDLHRVVLLREASARKGKALTELGNLVAACKSNDWDEAWKVCGPLLRAVAECRWTDDLMRLLDSASPES